MVPSGRNLTSIHAGLGLGVSSERHAHNSVNVTIRIRQYDATLKP